MKYRPHDSYLGKTEAARAKQLANLKRGRRKGTQEDVAQAVASQKRTMNDIVSFSEANFYIPETRKPIVLAAWQKEIFHDLFPVDGSSPYSLAILGNVKKGGKSSMAAIAALYVMLTKPESEVYILGPAFLQSQTITFAKCCRAIRRHKHLRSICDVRKDVIVCKKNDSFIRALSCSSTHAGTNPSLVCIDEAWRFDVLESKRAIDEMCNVPGRRSLILVTSYAGFSDQTTTHLWRWFKLGKDIEAGEAEKQDGFYFRWKTDYTGIDWIPKAQLERYLARQRRLLSDSAYRRFHQNEWVETESAFLSVGLIEKCTNPKLKQGRFSLGGVVVAIDLGVKSDYTAITVVGLSETLDKLALYDHRVFKPSEGQPVQLAEVENYIQGLANRYVVNQICYDPWQGYLLAENLKSKGLPMFEFGQTQNLMVQASENLLSLFSSGKIELYESAELQEHLRNAGAKDTGRGARIVKGGSQSKKVDLAISLAMSAQVATALYLREGIEPEIIEAGEYGGLEIAQFDEFGRFEGYESPF